MSVRLEKWPEWLHSGGTTCPRQADSLDAEGEGKAAMEQDTLRSLA